MHAVQYLNPDLRIPVGLARFMKKWGFTRSDNNGTMFDALFVALHNGVCYEIVFNRGKPHAGRIFRNEMTIVWVDESCKELERIMRDSQK